MKVLRVLILLVITGIGCSPIPAPEVKLSKEDYVTVDSLVKIQKSNLQGEIDSICKYIKKEEYEAMVDSITKVRLEYIKEIME